MWLFNLIQTKLTFKNSIICSCVSLIKHNLLYSQMVELLDFAKSRRKSWSHLRKFGNTKNSAERSRTSPNLIAQRIVRSSKVPADRPLYKEDPVFRELN